jgi:replicative DNA helicase
MKNVLVVLSGPSGVGKGTVAKMLIEKNVSSDNRSYLSPNDMDNLMVESVSERTDKKKRNKEIIYTSYEQFNIRSGGLEKGNLVILSAGSGVGKSALAINLVRDVAYVSNKSVLYLNSEMTDKQQARRYASLLSKVSHKAIRNGDVTDEQFNKIFKVANDFRTKQIHTITIPDMQLSHVIAEIKRMKTRADIALAVVDYVGRMDITKTFKKDMQEWQIMEQTARELKNLALELDIVIIMVAQLSSNGQTLAKGSSMKNECDLWINLKRVGNEDLKEYYDTHGEGLDKWWNVILDFKKARSAEFGAKIPMHFYGDELLFTDDEEEAKHFLALEQNNVAHNRD